MLSHLKLSQKGLILVASILLVEIAFVSAIFLFLLRYAEQDTTREIKLKKIVSVTDKLVHDIFNAGDQEYKYLHYETDKIDKYELLKTSLPRDMQELKTLLQDDPQRLELLDQLNRNCNEAMSGIDELIALRMQGKRAEMRALQEESWDKLRQTRNKMVKEIREFREYYIDRIIKADASEGIRSRDQLKLLLLGGLIANIVLVLWLSIVFTRGISNRLLILVENALRLGKKSKLLQKLPGNDEISQFDSAFHRMAEELEAAAARDREIDRQKQEFVAMVGHDLRTPLTAIGLFVQLAGSEAYGALSEEGQSTTAHIEAQIARLVGIINNIIDLNKLETGKLELHTEKSKLNSILNKAAEAELDAIEAKELELILPELTIEFEADPRRLEQLLKILIATACRNSPEREKVIIEAASSDGEIRLSVQDQGEAIPPDIAKNIFDRFGLSRQEASKSLSTAARMELSMCKAIADAHQGDITLLEESNVGNTFLLRLPISQESIKKDLLPAEELEDCSLSGITVSPIQGISISRKGMALIVVLTLLEIGFVGSMFSLVREAEEQARQEARCKEIVGLSGSVFQLMIEAGYAASAAMNNREGFPPDYDNAASKAPLLMQKLKPLVKDRKEEYELAEQIESDLKKSFRILGVINKALKKGNTGATFAAQQKVGPLLVNLKDRLIDNLTSFRDTYIEQLVTENTEIKATARQHFLGILLFGLLTNVLFAITTAVLFLKGISSRMERLIENVSLLKAGLEPLPRMRGKDEIAKLDQVFHDMAEALALSKRKEREMMRTKQEFAELLSSDLAAPLKEIRDYTLKLQNGEYGPISPQGKERCLRIDDNIARLIRLVDDLVDLNHLDGGTLNLLKSPSSLSSIISKSVDAVSAVAEQKSIKISQDDTELSMELDSGRIVQVIVNLLGNAIKFSPPNSSIEIEIREAKESVEIRIQDHGPGIPESHKKSVFERFQQVNPKEDSRKGSGLGLAICKTIIESHQGKIGVDSEEGKGSCFWIRLPKNPESFDSDSVRQQEAS